ncbi:Ca(2+)-dependent cysteine protease [Pleurotus pulmonarius]|nr:Ca(2+)-dependent cysteine protease [Pleurotus pulmonarius]
MCSSIPYVRKRKALLIGIGELDRAGPRNDAKKMRRLLMENYLYKKTDIVLMHDKQRLARLVPTKDNVLREIDNLVRDCQPGDHFVFHYSGHTGQQTNLDGTEVDGLDERIETMTGSILDDVLRARLVDPLCPGSQLVAILDSCHSATLLDLPHMDCQLSNTKLTFADGPPKEYPRVALADLKRPLTQCKNRLVRQPSSSKQPRAKKPRLTLDTVTRSSTSTFKSFGPLTSILPKSQASGFFSPVASNDDADDYLKAKESIDASSPPAPGVDFYDAEKCCKCRLNPRDEIDKDRLDIPRVVRSGHFVMQGFSSLVRGWDPNDSGANPNPPLHRLFHDISFSLFCPAYERANSKDFNEWRRQGFPEDSRPNAYQHPSLSSLQRLNLNHKLSL